MVLKLLSDHEFEHFIFFFSVWQKLEEENQEFFKAYYLRLVVMQQITEFNRLLERQFNLMNQLQPTAAASIPNSNGSHISACESLLFITSMSFSAYGIWTCWK